MKKFLVLLVSILIITGCSTIEKESTELGQKTIIDEKQVATNAFVEGEYEKALEYYNLCLTRNPKDIDLLVARGRTYVQLKNYDKAMQDFITAQAINKKALPPRVHLCRMLLILNKTEDAKKLLGKILNSEDFQNLGSYDKFLAYYMDGQVQNTYRNYNQAIFSLGNAIDIYNKNTHVFNNFGTPYINRFPLYQKAVAHHQKGENKQAIQCMVKYIKLTQKSGNKVSSKTYKNLAVSFYLDNNLKGCKAVLPKLTPNDRKDLYKLFDDDFFLQK